jgi:DNA-directed RNA polymerase specialized sigma24 family protein
MRDSHDQRWLESYPELVVGYLRWTQSRKNWLWRRLQARQQLGDFAQDLFITLEGIDDYNPDKASFRTWAFWKFKSVSTKYIRGLMSEQGTHEVSAGDEDKDMQSFIESLDTVSGKKRVRAAEGRPKIKPEISLYSRQAVFALRRLLRSVVAADDLKRHVRAKSATNRVPESTDGPVFARRGWWRLWTS